MLFPMTPEEKSLLQRSLKLAEENNDILRSMRRSGRIGTAMHVLYWAIIIITSFGAYYFIQPYLSLLTGLSGSSSSSGFNLNSAQEAADQLKTYFNNSK
jgi:hypothetical protein